MYSLKYQNTGWPEFSKKSRKFAYIQLFGHSFQNSNFANLSFGHEFCEKSQKTKKVVKAKQEISPPIWRIFWEIISKLKFLFHEFSKNLIRRISRTNLRFSLIIRNKLGHPVSKLSIPRSIQRKSSSAAECSTRAIRLRFRNIAKACDQGAKGIMKVKSVRPRSLSTGCLLITNKRTKTATEMPRLRMTALIIVELLTL